MKVIKIFRDVNIGKQHKGLYEIAYRHGVNLNKLLSTLVLFVNKAGTKVKCWAPNGVLSYLVLKTGTVNSDVIQEFAKAFDETGHLTFNQETLNEINSFRVEKALLSQPVRTIVRRRSGPTVSQIGARP